MGSERPPHLPHGPSFQFVDRILERVPGTRVVALKNVSCGDPHLQDHFPGNPIMPGVLVIEAMAQTSGLLLPDGATAVLAQIKEARFRRPVVPGDQLRIEAERAGGLGALHRCTVTASVAGVPVAEAEIILAQTPAPSA